MSNSFLKLVEKAERENWCVRPWCTTCGSRDFRASVATTSDLQSALESIDLQALVSHAEWCDMLRIVALDTPLLNWNRIFSSWLPFAKKHVDFADHVFFYLVSRVPCDKRTFDDWRETCISLALETSNTSLLESLVRILGKRASKYEDLLESAVRESSRCSLLRNALEKVGLVPPR